jgi:hypothetical protein
VIDVFGRKSGNEVTAFFDPLIEPLSRCQCRLDKISFK